MTHFVTLWLTDSLHQFTLVQKNWFFTTFGFLTPFFHGDPPKVRCQKMLPVSAAAQSEVGGSESERGCFMGRTGKSSILTGDVELPGDQIPVKIDDQLNGIS
jgi:hypothetical protein